MQGLHTPPPLLRATQLQPPLKWAGGKRWLVPTLRELWQEHSERRLVEPFVGGMAVALGLAPAQAVLNDRNPHLINFYRQIQQGLVIDLPMANDRQLYDAHRARFNRLIQTDGADSAEAAALFYFLNRTCFNGLCRFNNKGLFNVPFGRYSRIGYVRDFTPYRTALADWTFMTGDLAAIATRPDDLVYADPPYDVAFTSYSAGGFSWDDQVRLAAWLATHAGPVIASNQATPRILELYRDLGFTITILPAPRRIACNGDRTPAAEMLATDGIEARGL